MLSDCFNSVRRSQKHKSEAVQRPPRWTLQDHSKPRRAPMASAWGLCALGSQDSPHGEPGKGGRERTVQDQRVGAAQTPWALKLFLLCLLSSYPIHYPHVSLLPKPTERVYVLMSYYKVKSWKSAGPQKPPACSVPSSASPFPLLIYREITSLNLFIISLPKWSSLDLRG